METKEQRRKWNKTYVEKHPKKVADAMRAHNHGIKPGEYDVMLEEQEGCCAICGRPETKRQGRGGRLMSLAVDHDHETGVVRGLLCATCNIMLGHVEHADKAGLLVSALLYLGVG